MCSTSLITEKMHLKTTPFRMAIIKRINNKCWWDCKLMQSLMWNNISQEETKLDSTDLHWSDPFTPVERRHWENAKHISFGSNLITFCLSVENNPKHLGFKNNSKRFLSYYQCCGIFLEYWRVEGYVFLFILIHLYGIM